MALRLKIIDRDSDILLPPTIQEWVSDDHPARLVVEMIDHLDLESAALNHKGTGSQQYPPGMMLALLIYCYSNGIFSSRKIERATEDSVGVRYICANEHPDHDTICKFRRENGDLIRSTFTQTLRLAGDLKLVSLNKLEISTDGTTLNVSASEKQYKSQSEIDQELEQINDVDQKLEQQVNELLAQAEKTDREEAEKEDVPEALKDKETRAEKIREAAEKQKRLARRKAKLEAAREFQKLAIADAAKERDELREQVRQSDIGHIPKPLPSEVTPDDKINVHEPEAPKMKLKEGGYGFAFNAQANVDIGGIGLAVGGYVTTSANDRHELEPNIETVEANFETGCVATSLADSGYDNTLQIDKLEKQGIDVLCELQQTEAELNGEEPAPKRGRAKRTYDRRQEHLKKIKTEENRAKRKRRRETVEPLFGTIKAAMGFRQFMVRGLEGANIEWDLVLLCINTQKLGRNQQWRDFIKQK